MDIRTVKVERGHDGSFTVSDELTVVCGHGQTFIEAQRDYIANLLEYAPCKVDSTQARNGHGEATSDTIKEKGHG